MKREEVESKNGFKKQLLAIAVFGNKAFFANKEVKTFYNLPIKDALHHIIVDIVDVKSLVMYTFSEKSQGFEVDPLGTLSRKKISVEYLAKKELLEPITARIKNKNVL